MWKLRASFSIVAQMLQPGRAKEGLLCIARRRGQASLAHLLLERGAEATAQDNYGKTPLDMASEREFVEVSRVLLEHGARATAQDNQ